MILRPVRPQSPVSYTHLDVYKRQQPHAAPPGIEALMHVSPADRPYLWMSVENLEEGGGVADADLIEPAAGHADRMMMHANHRVAIRRTQCAVQRLQLLCADMPAGLSGRAAVDQHQAPVAQIRIPADLKRRRSPVSYTHLDVYKRQVLIWTLVAIAHILRSTLERGLGFCLLLAFSQMLAEELAFLAIFSAPH